MGVEGAWTEGVWFEGPGTGIEGAGVEEVVFEGAGMEGVVFEGAETEGVGLEVVEAELGGTKPKGKRDNEWACTHTHSCSPFLDNPHDSSCNGVTVSLWKRTNNKQGWSLEWLPHLSSSKYTNLLSSSPLSIISISFFMLL